MKVFPLQRLVSTRSHSKWVLKWQRVKASLSCCAPPFPKKPQSHSQQLNPLLTPPKGSKPSLTIEGVNTQRLLKKNVSVSKLSPLCQALSVVREHYFAGSFRCWAAYCACAAYFVHTAWRDRCGGNTGEEQTAHRWGACIHVLFKQIPSFVKSLSTSQCFTKNTQRGVPKVRPPLKRLLMEMITSV